MNKDRCDYCGRFVSCCDRGVVWDMVTPDSHLSIETWDVYHVKCKKRDHRIQLTKSKARQCGGSDE